MRPLNRALLAGAAVVTLGVGALAVTAAMNSHVLTVRLPDGTTEKIRYIGNTPPSVQLIADAGPGAFADRAFAGDPMFARLAQISAEMDRQAAGMMANLDGPELATPRLAAQSLAPLTPAGLAGLPAGAHGYTRVSTLSAAGVCTHTYEYVTGPNQAPKMTEHVSSGCKDSRVAAAPAAVPAQPAPTAPSASASPGLVQATFHAAR